MFSKRKSSTVAILIVLYVLHNCNAQINDNPPSFPNFGKLAGSVKDVTKDVKDTCGKIGECVRETGNKAVNKTITVAKESLNKIPGKSIVDVINNAKCVIPKDADNIVRAALLQQCISPSLGFGNESRCFDELGCFPMGNPWTSNLRPFPQPMKPEEIEAQIFSFSRKQNKRHELKLWPTISIDGSDFDPKREYTIFIIHGFNSDGENKWMSDLKDAYLKQRDANVFLVGWGKGSKLFNYLQVASNTRVVAAELIRFINHLVERYQLDPQRIHLMGHSLGAQISSYIAKGVRGVGRLTAFDPAQPGFEGCPKEVRLDKSDAKFVDVIHTSCRPTVPLLGFGLINPVGHVDIYMNGGIIQPGCALPPVDEVKLTSIADLAAVPADVVGAWVGCSHGRSISYFIESLKANNCTFWAQKVKLITAISNVVTVGQIQPLLIRINKCKFDECVPIGFDTEEYPGRGVFTAGTAFFEPYCKSNLETDRFMSNELRKKRSQNV